MDRESNSVHAVTEPKRSCVVYDSKTGRILHVHSVVAEPGARIPSAERIAKDAAEIARASSDRRTKGMKTLHVDPSDLASDEPKRVDVKKLTLVPARSGRAVKPQGTRKVKKRR